MASPLTKSKAIKAIEKNGMLLVYPVKNKAEPKSLWSELLPRKEMVWDWTDEAGSEVAEMWRLRENLSRSGEVVYAKYLQNRATFFSKSRFIELLREKNDFKRMQKIGEDAYIRETFTREAQTLLEVLLSDSPLSTKQIKVAADMRGKFYERAYEKAMKELWQRLWIVGYGEIDDGAFPSLAVGATKLLFEDLWTEATTKI